MTTLGKLLAFLNLAIGVAIASWSVSIYTHRPGWFNPKPEGGFPAGQEPENFAQLKEDIDAMGRAALAAGAEWGAARRRLERLEQLRVDRRKGYAERLEWAHNGRPKDPNQTGFFAPVYDPANGLLDLATVGAPIIGPDSRPLRGVSLLGKNINADVAETIRQLDLIAGHRAKFQAIGKNILETESSLLKMAVIRDSVQAELFHLESFEVNVYETRETVLRRQRQLKSRLAELGVK
jgi:hypothetical protein